MGSDFSTGQQQRSTIYTSQDTFTKTTIISIHKSHDFLPQAFTWKHLTDVFYIKIYYGILKDRHDSLKALAGKHDGIIEVQQPWPWKHNKHLYVTRLIYRETCTQHSSIDWYYSATSVCECIAIALCRLLFSHFNGWIFKACVWAMQTGRQLLFTLIYRQQLWVDIIIHWVFPWQPSMSVCLDVKALLLGDRSLRTYQQWYSISEFQLHWVCIKTAA